MESFRLFLKCSNLLRPGSIWIISDSKFNDALDPDASRHFLFEKECNSLQARQQPKIIRTTLVEILARPSLILNCFVSISSKRYIFSSLRSSAQHV